MYLLHRSTTHAIHAMLCGKERFRKRAARGPAVACPRAALLRNLILKTESGRECEGCGKYERSSGSGKWSHSAPGVDSRLLECPQLPGFAHLYREYDRQYGTAGPCHRAIRQR